MKIRTFKNLANRKFYVDIFTEDYSEAEKKAMDFFGEPEVNAGGLYGELNSATSGWILVDSYRRINSEFKPLRGVFDGRDYDDAEDRADTWAEKIKTRVQAAVAELRAQQDTFTEESVEQI